MESKNMTEPLPSLRSLFGDLLDDHRAYLKPQKIFQCNSCNRCFNNYYDLERHINCFHILKTIYQCPLCGYCNKNSGNISGRHAMLNHCCQITFKRKYCREYEIELPDKTINVRVGYCNRNITALSQLELAKKLYQEHENKPLI